MPGDDRRSRWLASDQDREEALQILRQALVDGRITTAQHGERVSKTLVARYVAEVDEVTADIPPSGRLPAPTPENALMASDAGRAHGFLRSTSVRPQGAVPRQLRSGAIWGNAEIDLRDAIIPTEGVDVRLWAYLGDVTVVVPPQVQVRLAATPILGRVVNALRSDATGPAIRIRALAIFGDIHVRTENPSSPSRE